MWNFPSSPSMSACSPQSMLTYQLVSIASSPSDSPTISMSPICIETELLRHLHLLGHLPSRRALLEERHDPLDGVGETPGPPDDIGLLRERRLPIELLETAVDPALGDGHG